MGTAADTGTVSAAREQFMHRAIDLARRSLAAGGPPVGAVLVRDNTVIAEAQNAVIAETDVTAHAEIMLLRQACHEQRRLELAGDELYVTVEPCMMCFAACAYAGIDTVWFGAPISRMTEITGHEVAIGGQDTDATMPQLVGGLCSDECVALLDQWQQMRGAFVTMNTRDGAAQYDRFAAEYQRTKDAPLRRHVEAYSFMRQLGDVRALNALDLACGDGYYSRRIKAAGAGSVTGIDISAEMIALAVAEEQRKPLGIRYHCADVAELTPPAGIDLVSAAYLLHYAPDERTLREMCRNIAACLQPGGRFVAINENPMQPAADEPAYTQYGFNKRYAEPRTEGSRIEYMMVSGREMIRFDVWYYSANLYETALQDAGFTDIAWHPLQLAPAGVAECGDEYWQAYMSNPPVMLLEARRA